MRSIRSALVLTATLGALASIAQAQEPDAVDAGAVPAGTGPYPAIYEELPTLPDHVVYRPQDLTALGEDKLGIYAYGNGGCSSDGTNSENHLLEIASQGYLAIAPGTIPQPDDPPRRGGPTESGRLRADTPVEALGESIDWAIRENGRIGSPFYGRIATDRVAVSGWSCGGLQALLTAPDPRVKTAVIMNSGIYNNGVNRIEGIDVDKSLLDELHGSVLYVLGGPTDMAHPNGMDDYQRITALPAAVVNVPVGHGGTFGEPNGGLGAQVVADWLDWQLEGSAEAARQFQGSDCGYCEDPGLTIKRKNID